MKKILTALFLLFPVAAQAQIVGALPFQLQNGTTADATQVMADFNKILNDTNANAAKNGVNTDITALTALVTPITPAQGGTTIYYASTSGGSANAQTVATPTPSGFTLAVGKRVTFVAGFTNTGAMTLNVNSTGATNVYRYTPSGPIALTGGEVIAGNYIEAVFDGTQYQLYTNATTPGLAAVASSVIAAASTVDLGTVPNHYALVTGASTINSFGSSASATYPFYKILFAGINTLTQNATSMKLLGSTSITTAANDSAEMVYLGSGNWQMLSYTKFNGQPVSFSANFLQGYINGCTLSTAGSSATMSIAACQATDSTNASAMIGTASSKTTSSWTVGAAGGGLDTGAIATGTWYHFFVMQRPDTGVVDYCISLSASACTTGGAIPAAYTLFRRIGSGKTDGSSHWLAFTQTGDEFTWSAHIADTVTANIATSSFTVTGVPTGVVVKALARIANGSGGTSSMVIRSLLEADFSPGGSAPDADMTQNVAAENNLMNIERLTNTSAQLAARATNNGVNISFYTYGWIDRRGKQ